MMRSQAEIRARLDKIRNGAEHDQFNFAGEALLEALERSTVEDLLEDPNVEWHTVDLDKTMIGYLQFAVGKALGHRGISAVRSYEKFRVWLWCLNDEDLTGRFDAASYQQYGAPKLHVLVGHFGLDAFPDEFRRTIDSPEWQNMIRGDYCVPGCLDGCGSEET